jgi:N-acetylneuraminic acid mutarotase
VAEDRWRRRGNLPSANRTPYAAVTSDRVLLIGGTRDGKEDYGVVHLYDADLDAWTARSPMPLARTDVAVAAVDGKAFVFGGWVPGGLTPRIQAYDMAGDRWMECGNMPRARSFAGAAAIDGRIYVVGGAVYLTTSSLTPVDDTERYDSLHTP